MDIAVDALYFQALESQTEFMIQEKRVMGPDFQVHFGARAKWTVCLPHDNWEVGVQFLHYHARTQRDPFEHMWRLHLGIGDLFLAYCWPISPCLVLKPFWGLRYGEIRHKIKQNGPISMKNKFLSLGPEIGMEGFWALLNWLSLYGHSTFSLLFGDFYVHQDIPPLKFFDGDNQVKSLLNFALGLRLQNSCFYGQAAFEVYLFPNQNQLAQFFPNGKTVRNRGDLSLHGLSFGLGAQF